MANLRYVPSCSRSAHEAKEVELVDRESTGDDFGDDSFEVDEEESILCFSNQPLPNSNLNKEN
jgi:hypothetical protein